MGNTACLTKVKHRRKKYYDAELPLTWLTICILLKHNFQCFIISLKCLMNEILLEDSKDIWMKRTNRCSGLNPLKLIKKIVKDHKFQGHEKRSPLWNFEQTKHALLIN